MPFTPLPLQKRVDGLGPDDAKIMIVGEALGMEEDRQGKPFVGPAGAVLEQCLHAANIIRSQCYITNVVKVRPKGNDISPYYIARNANKAGRFTEAGMEWVAELREQIRERRPNVIVPLGVVATHAVLDTDRMMKYRGYVMQGYNNTKVIPTIHPSAALRGKYIYRYLIANDLRKAREQMEFPEIVRPARTLIYQFPGGVAEAIDWVKQIHSAATTVSLDIEVLNYEIALLGLAPSPELAVSIPMGDNLWGPPEVEVPLWREIESLCLDEGVCKIVQNGSFDCHFLPTKCGIRVRGRLEDTMIAHSIMVPDMQKSLAFLASMYAGAQEYWKDMIKFDNIKDES